MVKDLTNGKPIRVMFMFVLPMLLSIVFQQMYNLADSVIAGKFAGEDALAAVGASYPITMIFMAIAFGCSIGCSVVIARLFGAKETAKLKTAVWTTVIAAGALSALLTVVGLLICKPLLRAVDTPENIFEDGCLYLYIYVGGLVFLYLYNVFNGIFQALGDSRTPLYFLIGSSIGNIGLDILFVAAFRMGVGGVAWATFIAQGIACVLSGLTLFRRLRALKTDEPYKKFSFPMLGKIAIVAVPSILQQSFISVGNIFIQSLINGYGSSVVAGYSAAMRLNNFAVNAVSAVGNGLSSFTSQNIGAHKVERVPKGFGAGLIIGLCVVVPFFCAFFFGGKACMKLFLDDTSALAMDTGVTYLKILSPCYFVIGAKIVADGVLRGSGAMGRFMITTFSDLVIRVALSFVLEPSMGTSGIWWSWPIGWIAATALSLIFYFTGYWCRAGKNSDRCTATDQSADVS